MWVLIFLPKPLILDIVTIVSNNTTSTTTTLEYTTTGANTGDSLAYKQPTTEDDTLSIKIEFVN
jgi:hypothetical protein